MLPVAETRSRRAGRRGGSRASRRAQSARAKLTGARGRPLPRRGLSVSGTATFRPLSAQGVMRQFDSWEASRFGGGGGSRPRPGTLNTLLNRRSGGRTLKVHLRRLLPSLRRGLQALVRSGRAELASAGSDPSCRGLYGMRRRELMRREAHRWARTPRPRRTGLNRRPCPGAKDRAGEVGRHLGRAPDPAVRALTTAAQDSASLYARPPCLRSLASRARIGSVPAIAPPPVSLRVRRYPSQPVRVAASRRREDPRARGRLADVDEDAGHALSGSPLVGLVEIARQPLRHRPGV